MNARRAVFKTDNFGPLNHPRAGARILWRVRLRLIDEWRANDSGIEWRDALDAAVGVVDCCLSEMAALLHDR